MKITNHYIIFFTVLMLLVCDINAQTVINEDFLDNIENNAKSIWGENAPAFASATIPEKYKDESAVIIGFKRTVNIDKKTRMGFFSKGERSLIFYENVRFKIKLNDKNAVQAFTEIYFRYNDKEDGFSARVIKPDGETKPVSLNAAVGVESTAEMPEFFKSFFDQQSGNQRRYYKVAIPDLEPGDVLEYVTITKSKLDVMRSGYIEFYPQYELCSKAYPILYNQIAIETDDKSFFKSMSLNGAPEFKKEPGNDNDFFRYVFTDYDRPVEKDVNFINPYQVYPLTKFQVIYSNSDKVKGALIGQKGEIKSGFSKEELATKAWEDYEQEGRNSFQGGTVQSYIDAIYKSLKKLGSDEWTEKEYINNVYYRLRNIVVYSDAYLSDKLAAFMFGSLLHQRGIKSELIICVSNNTGKIKDILFDGEIRYVVRVNNNLFFNCTDHSNPGDLVESLLGSNAYIISAPTASGQTITPFTLPNATAEENVSDFVLNVSLQQDMNALNVNRVSTYTGISKARNISDVMKFTPYMLDDYKNYGGESPTEKMKPAQEDEYEKSVKALKDQFKEAKPEFVKSELQKEYAQKVKYKNFSIASDGRSLKKKDLIYTEDFELPGMVRKAGKKYLLNLAGLIGSQLQIKKDERERKYDINVGYARMFTWTINFKIPDGYTAEGLKEMSMNVDNETGLFTSSAEELNGNVVLKIKKLYKKANISKDKWKDMLAFIDAAYNTSFKYILLKPKG